MDCLGYHDAWMQEMILNLISSQNFNNFYLNNEVALTKDELCGFFREQLQESTMLQLLPIMKVGKMLVLRLVVGLGNLFIPSLILQKYISQNLPVPWQI